MKFSPSFLDEHKGNCSFHSGLENCSVELELFNVPNTPKNPDIIFTGKCDELVFPINFIKGEVYTKYIGCKIGNNQNRFYINWKEADHMCKRENKSLPSFNSRQELMSFINYWYPHGIKYRLYGEIAVYIDLNNYVSAYMLGGTSSKFQHPAHFHKFHSFTLFHALPWSLNKTTCDGT